MTIPRDGQTVHLMNWFDVVRVLLRMHWKEGRNVRELALYTTDDLRKLYQEQKGGIVKLPDGVISRVQLVAEIRWRVWCAQTGFAVLMAFSIAGTIAAIAGAYFALMAWRFPLSLSG